MKNFLFICSFLIIIPFSYGNSDSKGCHSSSKEETENKHKKETNSTEKDKIKKDKGASSGSNGVFYCYPCSPTEQQ